MRYELEDFLPTFVQVYPGWETRIFGEVLLDMVLELSRR